MIDQKNLTELESIARELADRMIYESFGNLKICMACRGDGVSREDIRHAATCPVRRLAEIDL